MNIYLSNYHLLSWSRLDRPIPTHLTLAPGLLGTGRTKSDGTYPLDSLVILVGAVGEGSPEPLQNGLLAEHFVEIKVLEEDVEGVEVVLNLSAGEVEGVDGFALLFMVNLEDDTSPLLSKRVDPFRPLGSQRPHHLSRELGLRFLELLPDPDQLTHQNSLLFRLITEQMLELILKGDLLGFRSGLEDLLVDQCNSVLLKLVPVAMNFESVVDLL